MVNIIAVILYCFASIFTLMVVAMVHAYPENQNILPGILLFGVITIIIGGLAYYIDRDHKKHFGKG